MKLFKKPFILKCVINLLVFTFITIISAAPLSFFITRAHAQDTALWIVSDGSWKYSDTDVTGWFDKNFDDSSWKNTTAPSHGLCGAFDVPHTSLGDEGYAHRDIYANGGHDTWTQNPVANSTVYFRKTFTASSFTKATISGVNDDDGDIYINGTKVCQVPRL